MVIDGDVDVDAMDGAAGRPAGGGGGAAAPADMVWFLQMTPNTNSSM
jgi:hypothetical protein